MLMERILMEAASQPRLQIGEDHHHSDRIQAVTVVRLLHVDVRRRQPRQAADAADEPILDFLCRTIHFFPQQRSVPRS